MGVDFLKIFFAILSVLWFLYHWKRRKLYVISSQLPGPLAWPLVGNGLSFICKPEDLLQRILNLTSPYLSPMRVWLGPRLLVVVTDPDQLQILVQSPKMSTKSFVYRFLEPFMGLGLFTSSGTLHKSQRRILQPLFGSKYLESYSFLFQKHAINLVRQLEYHVDGPEFDVLKILHDSAFEATMDILVEDKNDHSIDYKIFPEYVRKFYHIFSKRVVSFWLYPDILYSLTNYYKEQQKMVEIVKAMTEMVKNDRLPGIMKRLECKVDENKNKKERIPSVLDLMVEIVVDSPGCLDEAQFIDHLLTFVATSQDTQSSALAFTLMMLGMHKHYQEQVYSELEDVLGNQKFVKYDDLAKLKFMEMCLKESMRLFPLGPFLPRDVLEEVKLDKWILPAGCTVILGVYQVHRNPKLWKKPDEFFPEHFHPEVVAKRHPYAFLPFSGGHRRCIAQQYSYVNMKIILSTILRRFTVTCGSTLKELELITDVSIRPKGGYKITLEKRL